MVGVGSGLSLLVSLPCPMLASSAPHQLHIIQEMRPGKLLSSPPSPGILEHLSKGSLCVCVREAETKPHGTRDRSDSACGPLHNHNRHDAPPMWCNADTCPHKTSPASAVAFEPSSCMLLTTRQPIPPLALGSQATTAVHRITHEHLSRQRPPGPCRSLASGLPRGSQAAMSTCSRSPLDP